MATQPAFLKAGTFSTDGTGGNVLISSVFSTGNVAKNLLIVFITWFGASTPTVSDTAGNTWTPIGVIPTESGNNTKSTWYYCLSCKGVGSNTVSMTAAFESIQAFEYTVQPGTTVALDSGSVTSISSGTGTPLSISTTLAKANALAIWSAFEFGGGVTYSGFTAGFILRSTNGHLLFADNSGTPAAVGSLTASATIAPSTNRFSEILAAFYPILGAVPNSLMLTGCGT